LYNQLILYVNIVKRFWNNCNKFVTVFTANWMICIDLSWFLGVPTYQQLLWSSQYPSTLVLLSYARHSSCSVLALVDSSWLSHSLLLNYTLHNCETSFDCLDHYVDCRDTSKNLLCDALHFLAITVANWRRHHQSCWFAYSWSVRWNPGPIYLWSHITLTVI